MSEYKAISPAKINLTLRILGTRDDGFHELESIVATLEFGDDLMVVPRNEPQLLLDCSDPDVPSDETNLIIRAAKALQNAAGVTHGARIELTKRIPMGAGLGGGSSNAATAMTLLNEAWGLDLDDSELAAIGSEIGSDVPLFFHDPLAVMRGHGEIVEPLPITLNKWVVLITPKVHCRTPEIYAMFDRLPSPRPRDFPVNHLTDTPAAELMTMLFNDLERPAFQVEPKLAEVAGQVRSSLGDDILMTGSGSAFFHLYDTEAQARQMADVVFTETAIPVIVTKIATH